MLQCNRIRVYWFRFRKVGVVCIRGIFYDVYETCCLNFCELLKAQHHIVVIKLRFLDRMCIVYLP